MSASPARRYRRSPHVAAYWSGGRFVVENHRTGQRVATVARVTEVLEACGSWQTSGEVAARFGWPVARVRVLLESLLRRGLVVTAAPHEPPGSPALDPWEAWAPAAALFHFSTKDLEYFGSKAQAADLRRRIEAAPPPPPTKSYPVGRRVALPSGRLRSGVALGRTLEARRTWRAFGTDALTAAALGMLLGSTWGVQRWAEAPGEGRIALKTSPSGGALHPGEAYVLVRRVGGIERGLYHYDAAGHFLTKLPGQRSVPRVTRYLPQQPWYAGTAVLVLMTAVIGRVTWKYDTPRAYRALLIEAGHLAQTFCLVATGLGLAPFCSMALADSRIEADLGIDGVSEIALYAVGAGVRPQR